MNKTPIYDDLHSNKIIQNLEKELSIDKNLDIQIKKIKNIENNDSDGIKLYCPKTKEVINFKEINNNLNLFEYKN